MNNGQVAGYVNFYHALDQARAKSVAELTREIDSYERLAEEIKQMSFLKRLFSSVGDPEVHIINQWVVSEKQLEARV